MRILTADEIVNSFDPIDQALVRASGVNPDILGQRSLELASATFAELDYLSWLDEGQNRAFLVTELPERLVGLVFRYASASGRGFCDLCCSVDRHYGTTLAVTQSWARPRTDFGLHICRGFDCSLGARGLKYVYTMSETISTGRRIERLQSNLERFVRSVTGLAPAPQLLSGRG